MSSRRKLTPPAKARTPLAPPRVPAARLIPDWPAYFEQFRQAHAVAGGGPVLDGGVLLFGDGWRYAADDHAGPELPPPKDPTELAALLARYWRRRRAIVRGKRDQLARQLEGLTSLQRDRPLPLLVKQVALDELGREVYLRDADGAPAASAEPEWALLVQRLNWLTEDVALCDRELDILGEE